jgi:hypothetical protein
MSDNLPHSGIVTVDARMYPENTQLKCDKPPRLPTTVGMAVETMVASTAARKLPPMTPNVAIARRVKKDTVVSLLERAHSTSTTPRAHHESIPGHEIEPPAPLRGLHRAVPFD